MPVRVISSPRAETRLTAVDGWLAARPRGEEIVLVAATADAAMERVRALARVRGAVFGTQRLTVGRLASELARAELARRDLAPAGGATMEAVCARVVQQLGETGRLGRFAPVAAQPGLPRALARTLGELRMAGAAGAGALGDELQAALGVLDEVLAAAALADRARVFELATLVARARAPHALLDRAVVLLDVRVASAMERALIAAVIARAPDALITVPTGDDETLQHLETALAPVEESGTPVGTDALARVQRSLFAPVSMAGVLDESVALFSAPGESRECVEIARRILREAERGVPFDRIAVALRTPPQYRVHVEEAFARAGIPAHFARGTVLPDPSGRALLALLHCASEGLSAKRFAEYLSLGESPRATEDGAPPEAQPMEERWAPPDEELLAGPDVEVEVNEGVNVHVAVNVNEGVNVDDVENAVVAGTLRAPWRWERLLVDAAVIGGRDRWVRRLDGLAAQIGLDHRDEGRESRTRQLADLAHLRGFALPLLDDLAALPRLAPWGAWLDALSALATRALRRPERVLAILAALAPMREVGPVELREVLLVLEPRLQDLVVPAPASHHGAVLVAPIDDLRGRAFDVVFVPGLAERMFPQKLDEDPLLLDAARVPLELGLETRADRLARERLALRIAVGAATSRVVLSYPRIDLQEGRPRVPSFYGLEVLQAAEGTSPDFDELGTRADATGAARIGWPAPANPLDAIDAAEHDLALLDSFARGSRGAAAYLLGANAHLARALRTRARRWQIRKWLPADGFITSTPEARAALDAHAPTARSFSPTALESLAACPLRFVYKTIVRLQAREEPAPVESLSPLERGSLVHEVQFELLGELREAGQLPVRAHNLEHARRRLDATLDRVEARFRDTLAPSIERVWTDGIAAIRADLREWVQRLSEDLDWTPKLFELAFGLTEAGGGRDPSSVDHPVALAAGITVRGSIDLVEESPTGVLRATDYKTGRASVHPGAVINGGKSLQPVIYALVLEQMTPGATVSGGHLYYCTTRGDFTSVVVPLDDAARAGAKTLADTVAHHVAAGFFPAAPEQGACTYCDFRSICGPAEEQRARRKDPKPLAQLKILRETR